MLRRTSVLFMIAAVAASSFGCVTWPKREIGSDADLPPREVAIVSVVKTSGETVVFLKSNPGRISAGLIQGGVRTMTAEKAGPVTTVSIPLSDVKQITYRKTHPQLAVLAVLVAVGGGLYALIHYGVSRY